jgi:hypothetical protein
MSSRMGSANGGGDYQLFVFDGSAAAIALFRSISMCRDVPQLLRRCCTGYAAAKENQELGNDRK